MAPGAWDTPHRAFLAGAAENRYAELGSRLEAGAFLPAVRLAASVKTNPEPRLLAVARKHGAYAEVISPGELALAVRLGFPPNQIVYNGPFRIDAAWIERPIAYAFADSLEAFDRYVRDAVAQVPGIRMRPPGVDSRFGIPIDRLDAIAQRLREANSQAFAMSFHVRPQDYGGRTWFELANQIVAAAARLSEMTGALCVAFDGGGGWTPEALDALIDTELGAATRVISQRLPSVRELILEPGQAIATPTEALITTVIEVRQTERGRDAVVDATIALLPKIDAYPHRMYAVQGDDMALLGRGPDRVLGCACLEDDILACEIALPPVVREGDRFVIADCGSYDASMAFAFAGHART